MTRKAYGDATPQTFVDYASGRADGRVLRRKSPVTSEAEQHRGSRRGFPALQDEAEDELSSGSSVGGPAF